MAALNYCSLADIQYRLSVTGVSLRIDDGPTGGVNQAIDRAGRTINKYLALLYDPANLVQSDLVNELAISLAVYFLCQRRMNAAPYQAQKDYEEAIEDLKALNEGLNTIYDIPARRAAAPVMSNVRTKLAPTPHTVTTPTRSTGTATDYQQPTDQTSFLTDFVI